MNEFQRMVVNPALIATTVMACVPGKETPTEEEQALIESIVERADRQLPITIALAEASRLGFDDAEAELTETREVLLSRFERGKILVVDEINLHGREATAIHNWSPHSPSEVIVLSRKYMDEWDPSLLMHEAAHESYNKMHKQGLKKELRAGDFYDDFADAEYIDRLEFYGDDIYRVGTIASLSDYVSSRPEDVLGRMMQYAREGYDKETFGILIDGERIEVENDNWYEKGLELYAEYYENDYERLSEKVLEGYDWLEESLDITHAELEEIVRSDEYREYTLWSIECAKEEYRMKWEEGRETNEAELERTQELRLSMGPRR